MQYKCVPAPKELVIGKSGNYHSAVRSFADLINREANDGWNFHSMENIAVTQKSGCLAALFGKGENTVYFNMLVFSKESGKSITLEQYEFKPTHKVKLLTGTEGMSLRKYPEPEMEPFEKIPNGTEIQYLSTGDEVSLGKTKGFWFEIKTRENTQGWCFSGSLEKI